MLNNKPLRQISQKKVLTLLFAGQILAGLGVGINVAAGTLIVADISGEDSWSGLAVTTQFIGATLVSVPLAKMAMKYGRRNALALGMFIASFGALLGIYGTIQRSLILVLLAFTLLGSATAASLQARFAATDLSHPKHRGRDLSIIVWSAVIGSVAGPNMVPFGQSFGQSIGLEGMSGVFIPPFIGQILAAALFFFLMRPDPLKQVKTQAALIDRAENLAHGATPIAPQKTGGDGAQRAENPSGSQGNMRIVIFAILSIALGQWVMTGLMSMTPVHINQHGGDLTIIGVIISLHIAGMYGISPLFGWMADRFGGIQTVLFGQAQLLASAVLAAFWSDDQTLLLISLILLGTGWSAATVASSALLNEYAPIHSRVKLQGKSDQYMNMAGALAAMIAGPIVMFIGFVGLAWTIMVPITVVTILAVRVFRTPNSPEGVEQNDETLTRIEEP